MVQTSGEHMGALIELGSECPVIYTVLYILGGAGFIPSIVGQYYITNLTLQVKH